MVIAVLVMCVYQTQRHGRVIIFAAKHPIDTTLLHTTAAAAVSAHSQTLSLELYRCREIEIVHSFIVGGSIIAAAVAAAVVCALMTRNCTQKQDFFLSQQL